MRYQAKNISDYKRGAEILYALYAAKKYGIESISKVAIQKILYLSTALAPIKHLAIELKKFIAHYRGPYNADLQNTLDHLVGSNYVSIVSYQKYSNKILVDYSISSSGERVVENLLERSSEDEKNWWITAIVRLIIINIPEIDERSDWKGFDKVVEIVYAEPTFNAYLKDKGKNRQLIDFNNYRKSEELIEYAKTLIKGRENEFQGLSERRIAELILISFFDFLIIKYQQSLELN
ncbi:hypothetical protein C9994_07810 [Marivirga lumbricoides]|uniref:Uncharacterized protein n=1 Tax=Marivirga lumbricoides TaxID=1046115 RepID=A0A2T4DR90_9BACT|nr:hypothetical protein C9994_07810 [Marivirga lumbricoides]